MKLFEMSYPDDLCPQVKGIIAGIREMQRLLAYRCTDGAEALKSDAEVVCEDLLDAVVDFRQWWTEALRRYVETGKAFALVNTARDMFNHTYIASYTEDGPVPPPEGQEKTNQVSY